MFQLVLFVVSVYSQCNCVGCQRADLIQGSRDWCRCCIQTLIPECQTTDVECQNSAFSQMGCLSNRLFETCNVTSAYQQREDEPPYNEVQCNCVGCQRANLIRGSRDWCRCCNQTTIDGCSNDTTTDMECKMSVFNYNGCVMNNYNTSCFFPPYQQREDEPRYNESQCNCVGCQRANLIRGSRDWCRCCNQTTIDGCSNATTTDMECKMSVFNYNGCVMNNYNTLCFPPSNIASNDAIDNNTVIITSSSSRLIPIF